ncbi:MAG: TerB family tellurite resistance protein [Myxococcota bacterium]
MDLKTRTRVCGLIGGMLSSDDNLQAHEAAFLQNLRQQFEIPRGTAIPPVTDRNRAEADLKALPDEVRNRAVELMVEAAAADGNISEGERAMLHTLAALIGVTPDEMVSRVEQQIAARRPQPFGRAD